MLPRVSIHRFSAAPFMNVKNYRRTGCGLQHAAVAVTQGLLSTHPPIEARVACLRAMPA
jgi:Zn-dependent protease with chaperone function